jgi:hypothetical protein
MLTRTLWAVSISCLTLHAAHAAGLCKVDETTVFSCELKQNHKTVSLCASKNFTDQDSFLQYRFGQLNKIELAYPKELKDSLARFGYDEYSRPDLSTFIVGFNNGGYRYELMETTEGGDDDGKTTRKLVVTSLAKKRSVEMTCLDNQNTVSDITSLDGVLKCDKEHEIVDGACQ